MRLQQSHTAPRSLTQHHVIHLRADLWKDTQCSWQSRRICSDLQFYHLAGQQTSPQCWSCRSPLVQRFWPLLWSTSSDSCSLFLVTLSSSLKPVRMFPLLTHLTEQAYTAVLFIHLYRLIFLPEILQQKEDKSLVTFYKNFKCFAIPVHYYCILTMCITFWQTIQCRWFFSSTQIR